MIAKINRRVKHLEKHLDVKIVYQGKEVNTLFERFSVFSFECADLVFYSSDYDFNTGNLTRKWSLPMEIRISTIR